MAGFVCKICGGKIRMNADSTGVCQECGMEYDLDAIKAMVGQKAEPAAPVQAAPQPAAPVAAAKDEIDRESLLVYLNDVRTMETIISETVSTKNQLELVYNKADERVERVKKEAPKEPYLMQHPENGQNIVLLIFAIICLVGAVSSLFIGLGAAGVLGALTGLGSAIALFVFYFKGRTEYKQYMKGYKRNRQEYSEKMQEYHKKCQQHNEDLVKAEEKCKKTKREANDLKLKLNNEKTELESMLQKAYSANIIPQQFRNIEGVYYLYDYLSTSNQSLSEALMQANLEAIKQKMDSMIKLQSAQIVQQAQANAKLDRVINISEATMNNTAVAAKYAQIAAVNSELNVKLAAESLAYQKAAFWLK